MEDELYDDWEDQEDDTEKDYSNVPIVLELNFEITHLPEDEDLTHADAEFCKANKWDYVLNHKAGPGVSCSYTGGESRRCASEAEAKENMNQAIEHHRDWLKCYNRPVNIITTLNGVKIDAQTKSLSNWF